MENENLKIKQLMIHIPVDLHAEIKSRAALRNITIKKWVLRAIMEQIKKEKQYE